MRRHCIILCIPLLIGCMADTQTFTYLLEPDAQQPYVYIKVAEVPGQQWRLWIPEVFSLQNDSDRHFLKPDDIHWQMKGDRLWYEKEIRESESYAIRMLIDVMPSRQGIVLTCTFTNLGLAAWGELANPAYCLSSEDAPRFHNPDRDRTYVRTGDAWRALSDIPEAMPPGDVYNHFLVEPLRDPEDEALRAYIDDGCVARENVDRSHTLVFTSDDPCRVDVNFNDCFGPHPACRRSGGKCSTVIGRPVAGLPNAN